MWFWWSVGLQEPTLSDSQSLYNLFGTQDTQKPRSQAFPLDQISLMTRLVCLRCDNTVGDYFDFHK